LNLKVGEKEKEYWGEPCSLIMFREKKKRGGKKKGRAGLHWNAIIEETGENLVSTSLGGEKPKITML